MDKCCVQSRCQSVHCLLKCSKCSQMCCIKHIQCENHKCPAPIEKLKLPEAIRAPKILLI